MFHHFILICIVSRCRTAGLAYAIFFIRLFLFKRIIKNCWVYITRGRTNIHEHANALARHSYCIFHVISYEIFTQTRRTHLPYPVITWFMCMCVLFLYFIYYSSFVLRFPLFNSSISIRDWLCAALRCAVMTLNRVTNTNISTAWQLSIFGIMIESGNKKTVKKQHCVHRAFAWTIS